MSVEFKYATVLSIVATLGAFTVMPAIASEINVPLGVTNSTPAKTEIKNQLTPEFLQGKALLQANKLPEAKTLVNNYLQKFPDNVDMLLLLGIIEAKENKVSTAKNTFKKILVKNPAYLDARAALIFLDIDSKKFDEASMLVDQGLQQNPNNIELLELKEKVALSEIKTLRTEGKIDLAKQKAIVYLNFNPNALDVEFTLGSILNQQSDFADAEIKFKDILQKKPGYVDARVALIKMKMAQNVTKEADALITQGLEITRQDAQLQQLKKNLAYLESDLKENNEKPVTDTANQRSVPTPQKAQIESEKNNAPSIVTKESETSPKESTKSVSGKASPPQENSDELVQDLKRLRDEGKIAETKEKALKYLQSVSKNRDQDVALILGLIYSQEKDYPNAEKQLSSVLEQTPDYIDARVSLIKIKVATKNLKSARKLLAEGLKISPNNLQLTALKEEVIESKRNERKEKAAAPSYEMRIIQQAKRYIKEKRYLEARTLLRTMVNQYPDKNEYRIALADYYLTRHQDMRALLIIRRGLHYNASDYDLLIKEGEIHVMLWQFALAARSYQNALKIKPNDEIARGKLLELDDYSPRYKYGLNEIGAWTDNVYVSDLHSIWDWTSAYYNRDTNFGMISAKVNYASRFQKSAEQAELNFFPRYNRNIYGEVYGSYANRPEIFPNYSAGGEGHVLFKKFFEFSAGGRYSKIKETFFDTWTGSVNLYPGNWWLVFRPYFFKPQKESPITHLRSRSSTLYTAKARRYFNTDDHFVSIGAGTGKSPDLSDLLTVNFIVIRDSFVNFDYSFPLFKYHLIANVGGGFQRWKYPSGLVRRLYDGSVSLKYRF